MIFLFRIGQNGLQNGIDIADGLVRERTAVFQTAMDHLIIDKGINPGGVYCLNGQGAQNGEDVIGKNSPIFHIGGLLDDKTFHVKPFFTDIGQRFSAGIWFNVLHFLLPFFFECGGMQQQLPEDRNP